MTQFHSQKQAKEYLIGRIVAEAGRENVPLSDVERKMLYFSETDWTLPGIMDVNAEFERDYDDNEYEEKIAGLARNITSSSTPAERAQWQAAVAKLREGDHYLLVLINAGPLSTGMGGLLGKLGPWFPAPSGPGKRPRGDFFRLIVFAFLCIAVAIGIALLRDRFR